MRYELRFRFPFAQSDNLIYGQLVLVRIDDDGTEIIVGSWIATSGLRGWQSLDKVWERGHGALPPSDQIAEEYCVDTIPQAKTNLGGLGFQIRTDDDEGTITPKDPQARSLGLIRSAFFLHLDNNFPGSAGCLVFPLEQWKLFYPTFHNLYLDHKIERVKLVVEAV